MTFVTRVLQSKTEGRKSEIPAPSTLYNIYDNNNNNKHVNYRCSTVYEDLLSQGKSSRGT